MNFSIFKTFSNKIQLTNRSIKFWIKIDHTLNSVMLPHTHKKGRFFHIFSRSTRGFNRNLPGEHKWQTIVYDRHWPHSVTKNGAHKSSKAVTPLIGWVGIKNNKSSSYLPTYRVKINLSKLCLFWKKVDQHYRMVMPILLQVRIKGPQGPCSRKLEKNL